MRGKRRISSGWWCKCCIGYAARTRQQEKQEAREEILDALEEDND